MPLCRDPLVSLLNSFGFNALRVPRKDYGPGSVLARSRDGTISLFGRVEDTFDFPKETSLQVTEALAGEQFEGATSANYRVSVAAKLLSDWISIATPSLASSFRGAKRISYQVKQTRLLSTSISNILRLLAEAEPTASLLLLNNARLFVIAEVLQAKELLLMAQNDAASTTAFSASLAPGQAGASANFELDTSKEASGVLRFVFKDYHTIGFKAHELEVANGEYRLSSTGKNLGLSHMAITNEEYVPIVFDGEPLI